MENCLKSDDQKDKTFKEQGTQKIKILNCGTTEHSDSFYMNKRMGTHWEDLNKFLHAKIQ